MTGLTKISQLPAPADPSSLIDGRTGKRKRVTRKVAKAIGLMLEGRATTFTAAAGQVEMHPDSLSRALKQPHVKLFLDERTHALLNSGKTIAAGRLMQLINAASEHVSLDATKLALGISGIRPAEPGISINIANGPAGYVIDLRNPRDDLPAGHPLSKQFTKEIPNEDREED